MAKTINMEVRLHAKVDGKKIIVTESSVRRDLRLADEEGINCLLKSIVFKQLALMGIGKVFIGRVTPLFPTMVIQNQSEMGEGSAMPIDPHHTPTILQPSSSQPQRHQNLGSLKERTLRCHEAIGDTTAQTRFKSVSKHSNDSLLARGNILQSDEDRLELNELMALCTNLQIRVLELEKTKTTQQNEINSLKRRVKKLEKRNRSRTYKLKRLYKVGLTARVESSRDKESLDDASGSTIVEEGEPVDAAGSGATTLAIGVLTLGADKSTLDGGLSNSSNSD
nr:hypothetical protein [Tanacetum cinerariifolium]